MQYKIKANMKVYIKFFLRMAALFILGLICCNTDSLLSGFANLALGLPIMFACVTYKMDE